MLRKLFIAAALVLATAASTPAPSTAIDYICSCQVCAGGSGPGCRDMKAGGRFTSCSAWWATYGRYC